MRLDLERRYKIKACLELRLSQRATATAVGISTGGESLPLAFALAGYRYPFERGHPATPRF